ncbi:hypothetical protein C882_3121 [Caenispirillum salinarum AK4]|uniref:FG-GAP repeat protein n=1 Tax=Caenispirillum salinarum AK4 TaxID=1238182 RepID=K9H3C6_9PROT|nr:VCBS repeat-containing protein [Caenispirillum salinarum]EKV32057.1 hypothetical protein C882_3121 [Caenispirillum salinarum AK4]
MRVLILFLLLAGLVVPAPPGGAARAQSVAVDSIGPDGVILTRSGNRYRVSAQGGRLGLVPAAPPLPERGPDAPGLIPHGRAVEGDRDIALAWLARPTPRYAHGVLGDPLEAAALRVRAANGGGIVEHVLPETQVFEDLYPRLADLDGDGRDEVIVVRAHAARGAAVAVYGLRDDALVPLAATEPPGVPNRWINPVGAADFDGDGFVEVAAVETPHIGGVLHVWEWRDGALHHQGSMAGVSNHAIGTPVLDLHAIADMTGDGRPDILLPDQPRTSLRVLTVTPERIREATRISLPGALGTRIVATGHGFVMGTTGGDLAVVPMRP